MRYLVGMSELDERGILLNCPKCGRTNRMRYEGLGKVFRRAAVRSAVVRRTGCNRERNRVTPSFAAAQTAHFHSAIVVIHPRTLAALKGPIERRCRHELCKRGREL